MRALTFISVLLFLFTASQAQQEPQYSQFMFNKLPINAAYTGGKDVLSIRALYRNQWVKIPGHPQTASISVHSPFRNEDLAGGLVIVHDRLGVTEQTWISGTYAYRIPMDNSQNMRLSFGINAGMLLYTSALTTLVANDLDDPSLNENVKRVLPDVGAGVYLDGNNFYVGASIPNFISSDLFNKGSVQVDFEGNQMSNARRFSHVAIMAGGVIPVGTGEALKIRPQMLFKHVLSGSDYASPYSIDFNLSLMLMDRVNIGGTYRTTLGKNDGLENGDSFDALLEFWPTKQLMIGYAYDFTISGLSDHAGGSHEIVLGFDFNFKKKKVLTPRYF